MSFLPSPPGLLRGMNFSCFRMRLIWCEKKVTSLISLSTKVDLHLDLDLEMQNLSLIGLNWSLKIIILLLVSAFKSIRPGKSARLGPGKPWSCPPPAQTSPCHDIWRWHRWCCVSHTNINLSLKQCAVDTSTLEVRMVAAHMKYASPVLCLRKSEASQGKPPSSGWAAPALSSSVQMMRPRLARCCGLRAGSTTELSQGILINAFWVKYI